MVDRSDSPLILLCAGGTGGHMFPACALAEELLSRGFRVAFATDSRGQKYLGGMESVPQFLLSSAPYLPGMKGKWAVIKALLAGYIEAYRLIGRLRPAVAVGFGGYPSAPPMFAALHRRIPTLIHEQNAILGMANILLAPFVDKISLSLFPTARLKPKWAGKAHVTGNPVRAEIVALSNAAYPDPSGALQILIVGGSQGAKVFSEVIPPALKELPADIKSRLKISQQARAEDLPAVVAKYQSSGLDVEVQPFFRDMPERLGAAHLLVARSGASTVAEANVAGRPALYVPFPWNRDNQQKFNAEVVAAVGGAKVLLEQDMTPDSFRSALLSFLENPEGLRQAAAAARTLAQPQAAQKLADDVVSLLGS